MRDALGLDPYTNAAADRAMVLTATGYVPIEANASPSPAGLTRGSMLPLGLGPVSWRVEPGDDVSVRKYSPDQPRVPAGNPDGGQWTSDDGNTAPGDVAESSTDSAGTARGNAQRNGAPANDSRVLSDGTPDNTWIPGAQYAAGAEEGEGENRARLEAAEPTLAQEVRLEIARASLQDVLRQVHVISPNWKPTPGLYETVEGEIANLEAQAREAQQYLLPRVGIGPGPHAGESIPARGPERDFTNDEREKINEIGKKSGCHTCGTDDPETDSGNWVLDHQPPSALIRPGQPQRLYPQCVNCMRLQGGWTRYLKYKR